MADDMIFFNGIDGDSGDYLVPPCTLEQVAQVAIGETLAPAQVQELQQWYGKYVKPGLGAKSGVNTDKLQEAGWAVIFADKDKDRVPAFKEALGELLAHRKEQAGDFYRELTYLDGESKADFLVRHKVGFGPADPEKLPYYVLIVGDPETIPFDFQYQLDVVYAVGRIHFDTPEEYAQYARSVVEAETGKAKLGRDAAFFGVQNPGDKATDLGANQLVKPLADWMAAGQADWRVKTFIGDGQATKAQLARLLGKEQTPAFLFTASHGMSFSKDPELQARHQGALLCQEWPGRDAWKQPIPQDFYLAYDDVDSDARLLGLVAFHFACFGAGTPQFDDFAHRAAGRPQQIAPRPFMSRLPQRLLSHPQGGALAVVSHVDRAWEYSITWKGVEQLEVFKSMIQELAKGRTVGAAMEYFSDRYAELSTTLAPELGIIQSGLKPGFNRANLVGQWTANNDARSYVIVGDPAVRLPLSGVPDASRAAIEPVTINVQFPAVAAAPVAETVVQQPAAQPAPQAEAEPFEATAFGLPGSDTLKRASERLASVMQRLADRLADVVEQATDLEVKTYVADDVDQVARDPNAGKLVAYTRLRWSDNSYAIVPEQADQLHGAAQTVHAGTVQQAIANRQAMIEGAISAASSLLGALRIV